MGDLERFLTKYSLNLTEQQKKAVEAVNGATLLLAVPGSGKTTTLVSRLGYMIFENNIAPENILVLTYTVAATRDMADRFEKIFGDELRERLEFRTINGVCAKIILHYSRLIGKDAFQLESDEKRKNLRISNIFQNVVHDYPTESEIKDISTAFTYIKNMMLNEEEISKKAEEYDYDLAEIYRRYNQSLINDGLMDYDDQMRYAYNILKSSPETLSYFQNVFKYICVDEAQDTSKIQHAIISVLSAKYGNLFMVGDEDQSIYAWRAAYPQALLNFESEHENAKVLVMEENFRSDSNIVESADRFIQKNFFRHKKTMFAHRSAANEIKTKELPSRSSQYEYLVNKLADAKVDTAVLYRNNDSVIPLVDRLDRKGIPFRIKNAELLFFTHRIVTDILNIIKFAMDPYDLELFMKIYYKMNTYLSKNEALEICKICEKKEISVLKSVKFVHFGNSYKTDALRDFAADMDNLSTMKNPLNMIHFVVNISGYHEYMKRGKMKDSKSYILRELARQCDSFQELLDRLDYLKDLLQNDDFSKKSNVILSTIHSSKGLEYDTVYMLDVLDGVLPESIADITSGKEERAAYEEERRIYYVGITRAKNRLVLLDTREKSTFINETVRNFKPDTDKGILFNKHKKAPGTDDYRMFCERLVKGVEVVHKKFGMGKVRRIKNEKIAVIDFCDKARELDMKILFEKNVIEFV